LTAENTLSEEAVADAILKMDLLVRKCYEPLKFAIQAQMSTIPTEEDKSEPDLDQVIDQTIKGVSQPAKERIKHYANWLIAKG
jgi:aromatic ring hydroxylase